MLKNAVYVLAAIGLIFVTIIIGIGWDVATQRGQPARTASARTRLGAAD